MIPRPPMQGETGLSDSEAAYLSETLFRDPQSIDYGKTPSNPVSRVLQRTEYEWQVKNLQPAMPAMRGTVHSQHSADGYCVAGRKISVVQESSSGLADFWTRGKRDSGTRESGIGAQESAGVGVVNV